MNGWKCPKCGSQNYTFVQCVRHCNGRNSDTGEKCGYIEKEGDESKGEDTAPTDGGSDKE